MELKEFEYILAIAKYKNITKAANSLFISQPSLSKYLKNLEKNLNIKLFDRLGNQFLLTYAGEIYIKKAKEIILLKNSLLTELQDINEYRKGRINIGFTYIRGTYLIPETIPKFIENYPNIEINLTEDTSSNLETLLLNGDIDIAILSTPIINKNLEYISLSLERILLLTSTLHPLSKNYNDTLKFPKIHLNCLKNDRFITQHLDQRTGQITEKLFKELNFTPKNIFYTINLESAIKLTINNFGVCFVTESHFKYLNLKNKVSAFLLDDNTANFELVVAFRRGSYLSKPINDYISLLKTCFN